MATTYKRPNVKKLQAQCDRFNAEIPLGSEVFVKLDGVDKPFFTKTTSHAQVLSGHTPVVWLKDVSGCYLVDRVSVQCQQCGYTPEDVRTHGDHDLCK